VLYLLDIRQIDGNAKFKNEFCNLTDCTKGWLYYTRQLYRQVLLRARISYGNSVRLSVCLSRPWTDSRPSEIETPGLHHMIAWSL